MSPKTLMDTSKVNLFGMIAVTNAMIGLLSKSSAPRTVNVTSTTASLDKASSEGTEVFGNADNYLAYVTSKAALNMATVKYAQRFRLDETLSHQDQCCDAGLHLYRS